MNAKMLPIGCFIVMMAGFAFMGASSNDTMTDRNTLWRVIGLTCIVGSMAVYAWFTRDEPVTRDPLALWGVVLFVVGAVLLFTLDGFWTVIGMLDIVAGGALVQKAYTRHAENQPDEVQAAAT